MIKYFFTILAIVALNKAFSQNGSKQAAGTDYNFGFENAKPNDSLPAKWRKFNLIKGYACLTDTAVKRGGKRSLLIEQTNADNASDFASVVNVIPAKYVGREIEFRGYMKLEDVRRFGAMLIRIDDSEHEVLQFNTLETKKINGTRDWQFYSVKAALPETAQTIYVASILGGPGKLWTDDCQVLIDGKDISEAPIKPDYNPLPQHRPPYGRNKAASGLVKIKDADLYYETYGNGEPILLLHGNSQNIMAFKYQIGDLAKKYKVIAVDTRGQGKSTDMSTGPLTYDLFAADMKQLLDSLHIRKVNILGWSDGGNTGLTMAVRYPGYVNKLAIMGSNLFPTTDAVPDSIIREVKAGIKGFQKQRDEHSKLQVRLLMMLITEPRLTFDELKTIKSPVLVMAGEHDLILEKHTKAIAAAIPHSQLIIFKGATHYAPVEVPKAFNEAVMKFMGSSLNR